jgi:hypothetical protein
LRSIVGYSKPITEIIERRFSCRTYLDVPIEAEKRQRLEEFLSACQTGPLGTATRFELVVATEEDRRALRGLGTYGLIRGATGFVLGAVSEGEKNLEDFGYLMEQIVLQATDLGLGTCWLGGIFARSRFAERMALGDGELMPAVVCVGYMSDDRGLVDRLIRRGAGSDKRLPWERLFFDRQFGVPISRQAAGAYAVPLEMVRLGPSASNRQPWRIVKDGDAWHFYLRRTLGYYEGGRLFLRVADLQRVDVGIAMCHFALTADELGLRGAWAIEEPDVVRPDDLTEYVVSWVEGRKV